MASALQLPREELLRAYRQMRTIREFEDTVHDEFSAGNIPGFVHLYAGEEASGVGVCLHLDDRDVIASTHPPLLVNMPPSVAGNARIDEAKMIGITPPVLTFNGMCVLEPPYMRRPTTRLAYWTVIRRCPRSTKTMAPMTPAIRISRMSTWISPS